MQGGTALSAYAAHCRLQIERRTIPGETEAQVVAEIQTIIDQLAAADATFKAGVTPFFVRDPFEVSPEKPIVQALNRAATVVLGQAPPQVGQTPWMDSAFLAAAGIETVIMGPRGAGAHADEEWVDLNSTLDLAMILAQTTVDYCGYPKPKA